jgi:hypothetical protein
MRATAQEENLMSARAEALAKRFEEQNATVIASVQNMSDADWSAPAAADDPRPRGVVAHHVAMSYQPTFGLLQAIASGQGAPPVTWDMIHAGNAQHAEGAANVTRDETVAALREHGQQVATALRGLSDDQLDATARIPLMGDHDISAEQIGDFLVVGHIDMHAASIKGA